MHRHLCVFNPTDAHTHTFVLSRQNYIVSQCCSAGAPYLPASWTPEQLETNLAFKDHPTKVYDVELLGEWSQLCPQAFRGACAIAFYSKDNRETEIEILVNASKHLSIAEDGKLAGMIQFMTVDPICQRSFSEIFGVVANDKPALIAYGPNNGLFTTLKGNFNSVILRSKFPLHVLL